MNMPSLIKIACLFLLLPLWIGCKHNPVENAEVAPPSSDESGGLILTAAQIATAGIAWAPVEMRKPNASLKVTGELAVHQEHIATVSAFTDGFIAELRTGLNKPVQKGQVLALINKPDLVDLQQEWLETKEKLVFLNAEYERQRQLKDENATALKNFQRAEAERREAQTHLQLLEVKLRLYQVNVATLTPANVRTQLAITAPFSGIITQTFATTGSAVDMGTPICEILDLQQLHADVFVFEKDLSKVHLGQTALLSMPGQPQEMVIPVEVYSIDPGLDPAKKAVRLHARWKNTPRTSLFNGAYVEAQLALDGKTGNQPALPAEAVVREENDHYIFVVASNDQTHTRFQKMMVSVAPAGDGYLAITPATPLAPDALVVTKGAYYVGAQGKVSEFGEEE